MPLGKPAVEAPRTFDLRAVQLAVNNIRQRLIAADAEIVRLQSVADASTSASSIMALQASLVSLQGRVTALEASLGQGDVITLTAQSPVAAFEPVVPVGASQCEPADASDPERIFAVIGIARAAAAAGASVQVQRRGAISIPGAVFDAGRAVYVGLGGLTQVPSYGEAAIPVGVAISTGAVWVAPGFPALMALGLYGSAYDDAMPVTWGLLRERMALLETLVDQPDGFVVKTGDALVTRTLVVASGSSLDIDNPDGVLGDPIFTT